MRKFATTRTAVAAFTGVMQLVALGSPVARAEQVQNLFVRTAATGLQAPLSLSKNEYRYVERQEQYNEEVPYDVQIPYEAEETDYTQEQVCEPVARTHEVCQNESFCESRPRQECHEERRCLSEELAGDIMSLMAPGRGGPSGGDRVKPGGGYGPIIVPGPVTRQPEHREPEHREPPHREPERREPEHREPPHREPEHREPERREPEHREPEHRPGHHGGGGCSSHTECREVTDQYCGTRPVCHTETTTGTECRTVSVPHVRMVTRYRTETHYRTETRVRTVTDQILDHTWGVNVVVNFPQEAALQGDETERVTAQIAGNEAAPDAAVSVDGQIFNYRVANKQLENGTLKVDLQMVAKYSAADLGPSTVTGLALVRDVYSNYSVQFKDAGNAARVATKYFVQVLDRDTNKTVFEQISNGSLSARDVILPVGNVIDPTHDHSVKLVVSREGIVIAEGAVQFEQSVDQIAQLDPKPQTDPNGVRDFTLLGVGAGAQLVFTDAAPVGPSTQGVVTTYDVTIKGRALGFLWFYDVAKASFNRAGLAKLNGRLAIPVTAFAGLDAKKLADLFKAGNGYFLEVTVRRASPRLAGYSPVQFKKEAQVRVPGGRRGD